MTNTTPTDELSKLCKQVYEATGWEGNKTLASDTEGDERLFVVSNDFHELGHDAWRVAYLYDSDYLLEKLPAGVLVRKNSGLSVSYVAKLERVKQYTNAADTPLKALLKLTLALQEAKLL